MGRVELEGIQWNWWLKEINMLIGKDRFTRYLVGIGIGKRMQPISRMIQSERIVINLEFIVQMSPILPFFVC